MRVPVIRRLARDFSKEHAVSLVDASALMDAAARKGRREELLFCTFLVARHAKRFDAALWPRLDAWAGALDNWETCDQLAIGVSGELLAMDVADDAAVRAWARSREAWRRRLAAATTTALHKRGRSHPKEALAILSLLVGDEEPMVEKAFAWAVREACRTAEGERLAFAFLKKHRATLSRRVLGEASGKLRPGHASSLRG